MPERVVVVGASLAGLRAAQAVRSAGHAGALVVVGDERHAPYTRPPLSKQLLAGEQEHADCAFPVPETLDAEWRLGAAAVALDRERKVLALADGAEVGYDRLIVATGARARRWPDQVDGVHTLRDVDDALALRAALDARPGRVAIVGAGFVGCEVAATARKAGIDVTLIDVAPRPLLPLGAELGERAAELHRAHGVDLRLGTAVAAVDAGGVTLDGGARVDADVVLVALGAIPNTEWLASSGLALDERGGIVCDGTLTSVTDDDILAAGDVVSWPHPLAAGEVVRVEHWTVAAEHGALAGRNALADAGERTAHVAPPYFWSDQYDVKIQAVGFPARAATLEVVEEDGPRLVAEARDADGRLVGAIAFNNAKKLAAYRRELASAGVAA
ncbi:MAG TPA: FAD-dependent oxidoreductase [Baekduia sp.]|uniref:NAD(P)/FAD-dependent oxidoreductase n=1 Tax=Baekduia sp. TaxID=2600305 RepID=UPI002D77BF0D|nr:FAD-dependent oxidoreductase [Baekduia sp.]HET6510236.1 FAD-dependent oxidoreductase [Baekduia sp.]